MTKPNRFERSYRDTTPIRGVTTKELSNLTPLHRSKGVLSFSCDHCGIPITKHWYQAKRAKRHFCGVACAVEAKKVREQLMCRICGSEYEVKKSNVKRVTTCSKKCSKILLRHNAEKLTELEVVAIMGDSRSGRQIAGDYGISQHTVSSIKLGKTWSHVTKK